VPRKTKKEKKKKKKTTKKTTKKTMMMTMMLKTWVNVALLLVQSIICPAKKIEILALEFDCLLILMLDSGLHVKLR